MEHGLIHAFLLDGKGGAKALNWPEVREWQPSQGLLWVHLDYSQPQVQSFLEEQAAINPLVAEALQSGETRPRATRIDNGLLMALRGINLNPGAEPDDMVSVRIWAEQSRVISTRKRRLMSVTDVAEELIAGSGPRAIDELLSALLDRLVSRMSDTVDVFEDQVAEFEEQALEKQTPEMRAELGHFRRQIIALRRYLAPQREAISQLLNDKSEWLSRDTRLQMQETQDRLIRHIEDLDAVRERAAVTQEEIGNQLSEQLNSRMYVLSIVAAFFLPLGFLTGLLGINVGGIPGADSELGFGIFIGMLIAICIVQIFWFRRKGWM
ncbi:zinc transporter ZntB [Aliiglaciecola sp. CAU 1673]|uniref:zinc transporter ZntB n=1 Tax=Aliiglaciecola sp. CAU 1673 TaxID=3032595 RepID=UPI0023DAA7EA|nr:zinc transporter ZntB [Aliiglaciecola sp. CAU 1673]MDF2177982.1 zinc transporter ZntB [Aliiglaciecola sp. CAU 1673]